MVEDGLRGGWMVSKAYLTDMPMSRILTAELLDVILSREARILIQPSDPRTSSASLQK